MKKRVGNLAPLRAIAKFPLALELVGFHRKHRCFEVQVHSSSNLSAKNHILTPFRTTLLGVILTVSVFGLFLLKPQVFFPTVVVRKSKSLKISPGHTLEVLGYEKENNTNNTNTTITTNATNATTNDNSTTTTTTTHTSRDMNFEIKSHFLSPSGDV